MPMILDQATMAAVAMTTARPAVMEVDRHHRTIILPVTTALPEVTVVLQEDTADHLETMVVPREVTVTLLEALEVH